MIKNKNSFVIKNIFDQDEIDLLIKISQKTDDIKNQGDNFFAYTNGFSYNFLPATIRKKITDQIGPQYPTVCMILKEHVPWPIHSDYSGKNDKYSPSWAVLIPLDYSIDTHTVIFAEKETQNLSNYKKNNTIKNYSFSEEELHLLSHVKKEDLQYVSEPIFYQWKVGSLICWQRNLLHCSDNFKSNDNDYKTALVAFFCDDD